MTCDAHFRTRTRDDVCEHVCVKFRDNRLRNEVCRAVTPFGGGRAEPPIRGGYM